MGSKLQGGFMLESKQLLELAVKAADDKRAEEIVALDVSKVSLLADYFVICHGNSSKQVVAIVDAITDGVYKNKGEVKQVEGRDSGKWVLVDLGDVIVHVFNGEERAFYNLEKLWRDAPMVNISGMID